jgi:nucleotide-binding universal stress UspA family protein
MKTHPAGGPKIGGRSHGYGPVEKHFVGSTTDKVLAKLERPVLTVKI